MSEIAKCERCREYNAAAVDFRNQATNAQNDYAALQSRHNALRDAVAWERECEAVAHWQYEVWELAPCGSGHNKIYGHAVEIHAAARAEVDRLIADCKGEEVNDYKNLEWLVLNALHGDVSGENPDDLRRIIMAKDELDSLSVRHSALLARVARLEEALKELLDYTRACEGLLNASESGACVKAHRALEEKP